MDERMKHNLTSGEHWIRLLYMVLFALLLYVVSFVVAAVVVVQFLISLITGTDNRNVRWFGHGITVYVQQILMFLTYNSNFKPFPFSDWPEVSRADDPYTADSGIAKNAGVMPAAGGPAAGAPAAATSMEPRPETTEPTYEGETAAAAAQSYVFQSDLQNPDAGLPADAGLNPSVPPGTSPAQATDAPIQHEDPLDDSNAQKAFEGGTEAEVPLLLADEQPELATAEAPRKEQDPSSPAFTDPLLEPESFELPAEKPVASDSQETVVPPQDKSSLVHGNGSNKS